MELIVHDLVRIDAAAVAAALDAPAWVTAAIEVAPWAVVRRAAPVAGLVPIGVRGATRAERFATTAPSTAVLERLRPEDLRMRKPARPHLAFESMDGLAGLLDATSYPWGPGGSAAFELATGQPTLKPDSDLDLIVRGADFPDTKALAALSLAADRAPLRVDILIETKAGGVALAELLGPVEDLLLRTTSGPRLVRRAELLGAVVPC